LRSTVSQANSAGSWKTTPRSRPGAFDRLVVEPDRSSAWADQPGDDLQERALAAAAGAENAEELVVANAQRQTVQRVVPPELTLVEVVDVDCLDDRRFDHRQNLDTLIGFI